MGQFLVARHRTVEADIGAPAQHLGDLRGRGLLVDAQGDSRMQPGEMRQKLGEAPAQDRAGCPDFQQTVLALLDFADLLQAALILVQHVARPGQKQRTGPRQRHLAAGAVDEFRAHLALKCLDLRAQRRLRHVQPPGGAGEVQLFGQDDEAAELAHSHSITV